MLQKYQLELCIVIVNWARDLFKTSPGKDKWIWSIYLKTFGMPLEIHISFPSGLGVGCVRAVDESLNFTEVQNTSL